MTKRHAFTLVEMSIVLVIIGLLVGGILVGQNLIRAQALRNVLEDAKLYAVAIQQFNDKYGSLPGDMPDAERVWGNAEGGAVTTNCATPSTSASVGALTCNGNGNGQIETGTESYRAWQQLAAAGLIKGKYTGVAHSATPQDALPGSNIPMGALGNTGYYLASDWGYQTSDSTTAYAGDYTNLMIFGQTKSGSWPHTAALTPSEAYEMDKKMDDGMPGTGSIRTFANTYMTANVGTCVNSNTGSTAAYVVSSTAPGCILLFLHTFQAKPL